MIAEFRLKECKLTQPRGHLLGLVGYKADYFVHLREKIKFNKDCLSLTARSIRVKPLEGALCPVFSGAVLRSMLVPST